MILMVVVVVVVVATFDDSDRLCALSSPSYHEYDHH